MIGLHLDTLKTIYDPEVWVDGKLLTPGLDYEVVGVGIIKFAAHVALFDKETGERHRINVALRYREDGNVAPTFRPKL